MIELPVIDAADQEFSVILLNRRATFRLRYAPFSNRWSMDLSIDDEPVLHGRRIVLGVDLLATFDFGLGHLVASPAQEGGTAEPGRTELPNGVVRLYHFTDADIAAAVAVRGA
jgi:hypothetical protein